MGYADRDYIRQTSTQPPSRLAGAPVVKWLLIINIGVFAVDLLFALGLVNDKHPERSPVVLMVPQLMEWQLWRLITFQFLHADFGHLLFNMVTLYFFGSFVEQALKSRGFLVFYLLCGIAGAALYSVLELAGIFGPGWMVGASAGIFGTLAVAYLIAPDMKVRLLIPPVTLTMRQLALLLLAMGVVFMLLGINRGGQIGHLGGALAGVVLYKIPALRNFLERISGSGKTRGPRGRGAKRERVAKIRRPRKPRYEKKLRPKSKVSQAEATEVDRILDKINEHGLQSLTEEERELLTRAGKK